MLARCSWMMKTRVDKQHGSLLIAARLSTQRRTLIRICRFVFVERRAGLEFYLRTSAAVASLARGCRFPGGVELILENQLRN